MLVCHDFYRKVNQGKRELKMSKACPQNIHSIDLRVDV